MNTLIGTGVAVAGAQICTMSEPTAPHETTRKFVLLKDLGIIKVPDDYRHSTQFGNFLRMYRKKFWRIGSDIDVANFPDPSHVLRPGDKFRVRVFGQAVGVMSTTTEERMAFLNAQGDVHIGPQGVSLIFEQKRILLPEGSRYISFDKEECLWIDDEGRHRVPCMYKSLGGSIELYLGYLGDARREDTFFCCSEVS